MANYHPHDELLLSFAAGQLPNALGIIVACHVEECSECQQRVKFYERLGGEILANSNEAAVSDRLLGNILRKLDEPAPAKPTYEFGPDSLPRPLRRFVLNPVEDLTWSGLSKSIREYTVEINDPVYKAKFYKIAAGKELPEHTHQGNEYTYVVSGSFSDKANHYHQGDFILADSQVVHQPRASMEADCICFAVMDAPLKMTGFFGRMLNPFLK